MIVPVILALLRNTAAINNQLGDYSGGQKSIFDGELPENAGFPAIVVNDIGGRPWGCRTKTGSELSVDVQVFHNKNRSKKELRALAWAIHDLLDRHDLGGLDAAGYENWGCEADPPAATNDGLEFPGYTVRLLVRVLKK